MIDYLAYKALVSACGEVQSPLRPLEWYHERVDIIGGITLVGRTEAAHVRAGIGIHAGTYRKAATFFGRVYLVAPLPGPDGKCEIAVGTCGWRAEAAFVVMQSGNKAKMDEVVVSAWRSGYACVPGVVLGADGITEDEALGLFMPHRDDPAIVREAIIAADRHKWPQLVDVCLDAIVDGVERGEDELFTLLAIDVTLSRIVSLRWRSSPAMKRLLSLVRSRWGV